jgi:hypothetical protein
MLEFENKLLIILVVMFPVLLCTIMYASVKHKELQIPNLYLYAGKSFLYFSMIIYCLFFLFVDIDLSPEISGLFVMIVAISMLECIHNLFRTYESFLLRKQYERSVHNA